MNKHTPWFFIVLVVLVIVIVGAVFPKVSGYNAIVGQDLIRCQCIGYQTEMIPKGDVDYQYCWGIPYACKNPY